MGPLKGGVSRDSLESWLMSWGKLSGTRGQTTSQSDPGPVLHGEMLYLLVLPYSHDSAPTSEPVGLLTWGKRPRLTTPSSSYTSPGKACIIRQGRSIMPWRIPSDNFIRLILKLQAANQTDNLQQTFAEQKKKKKKIHRAQNI